MTKIDCELDKRFKGDLELERAHSKVHLPADLASRLTQLQTGRIEEGAVVRRGRILGVTVFSSTAAYSVLFSTEPDLIICLHLPRGRAHNLPDEAWKLAESRLDSRTAF